MKTKAPNGPNCHRCGFRDCSYRDRQDFAGCEADGAFIPSRSVSQGPSYISYPGLDERESLNEFVFENFQTESDYIGFEVGDQ